jgi:hypothetical protein
MIWSNRSLGMSSDWRCTPVGTNDSTLTSCVAAGAEMADGA